MIRALIEDPKSRALGRERESTASTSGSSRVLESLSDLSVVVRRRSEARARSPHRGGSSVPSGAPKSRAWRRYLSSIETVLWTSGPAPMCGSARESALVRAARRCGWTRHRPLLLVRAVSAARFLPRAHMSSRKDAGARGCHRRRRRRRRRRREPSADGAASTPQARALRPVGGSGTGLVRLRAAQENDAARRVKRSHVRRRDRRDS